MSESTRTYEIHARIGAEQRTAVSSATLPVAEIGPWLGRTYQNVASTVAGQGHHPVGPPFARYHRRDDGRFDIEAGFPVSGYIWTAGGVRSSRLPGGKLAATMHVGPYDQMEPAYRALTEWIRENGGEPAGDAWEVYLTGPATVPDPAAWRTEVVQPYQAQRASE